MMKNSQTSALAREEEAVAIGIAALQYLAGEPELLGRFLDLSGLTVSELRQQAEKPAFFAGLLDFLLDHEPTLEAFAAQSGHPATSIAAARTALASAYGVTPQ